MLSVLSACLVYLPYSFNRETPIFLWESPFPYRFGKMPSKVLCPTLTEGWAYVVQAQAIRLVPESLETKSLGQCLAHNNHAIK